MPYAVYRLTGHNPAAFGIGGMTEMFDTRSVIDSRFSSFGKNMFDVQQDLFNFVLKIQRDEEENRIPDDLELMYVAETRPFPGMPHDPLAGAGVQDIQMEHHHHKLVRAFESLRLETVLIYGEEHEALIDAAREIVRDREVTIALARVSNPHARVVELSRLIHDIDRDSKRCVSFSAAATHEDCIEILKSSVETYQTYHQSLRFVTLATEQKES